MIAIVIIGEYKKQLGRKILVAFYHKLKCVGARFRIIHYFLAFLIFRQDRLNRQDIAQLERPNIDQLFNA